VRFLVLWDILSVLLELRQDSLALALVNLLFKETIRLKLLKNPLFVCVSLYSQQGD
jgi:hypothetical protein